MFESVKIKNEIVNWIKDYFDQNGKQSKCVIGLSGGKDSSIVAALCVEALGKDRVIGVTMPYGETDQDISFVETLVDFLNIQTYMINILPMIEAHINQMPITITKGALLSLKARTRMCTLYNIAQSIGGRVANTSNLSEDYIGYFTRFGDGAGDFSPLGKLTVTEVKEIGYELGLPKKLIEKPPSDGLCGLTDEEALGFSYDELDKFIRGNFQYKNNNNYVNLIKEKHEAALFKLSEIPSYQYPPVLPIQV